MHNILRKALAPLQRRVLNLIARGVIKAVKDSGGLQRLQMTLLAEETANDIERIQEYGFASNPKDGAEGLALFLGGDRSHGVVIATDDRRYRMKVSPGKVAIYDDEGQYVYIKTGGVVEVKANTKVLATAPLFETSSNAKIGGNLEVVGTSHLTGTVTADAAVTAAGVVSGASINAVAAGVSDVGAKINELKTKHNGHKHTETGTITAVPDLQVT